MKKKQNMSHGRKAARNFLLVLLALWLAGVLISAPVWLVEGRVRARAAELGYSRDRVEILYRGVLPYRVQGERPAWLGGTVAVLGRTGDQLLYAEMSCYERPYLSGVQTAPWPKETAVYHLFDRAVYQTTWVRDQADALVAVNLPQGTEHGQMTLVTGPGEHERWSLWGERTGDVMFFWISREAAGHHGLNEERKLWNWLERAQYAELKLINKDLKQIQSTRGTVETNWRNGRETDGTG